MEYSVEVQPTGERHVVAMPSPGRGHINPMMNLCKLLVSRDETIHVTFVVTEEWLGFIGSDPKPDRISFGVLPNVVPSELVRANNLDAFTEAVMTKIEAPFEQLLDRLEPKKPSLIIADSFLYWAVGVGNRRSIEVASFWPMSPLVFSVLHHFHLLEQNGHFPVDLAERGSELVDYIPGLSPTRLVDLPVLLIKKEANRRKHIPRLFTWVLKAQYILFPTVYELEPQVINALKGEFSFPIYTTGPTIPYFSLSDHKIVQSPHEHYLQWLDWQPQGSVLYISFGSFLAVSSSQMDEIAGGLRKSGVRFLWVARDEANRLRDVVSSDGDDARGLVVPWCDQLRVLCHASVAGFWSHCGWNSVREGVFAGVPFLTLPIVADQILNSKVIAEDWKIGWRVKRDQTSSLVGREEIASLVSKFMDLESDEGKEMRRRARELKEITRCAIAEGGSSESNINAFLRDISK